MTIYPAEYFAPKDFKTGQVVLTDKTYSIHHYDASWMEPEDKQVLRIKWAMENIRELENRNVHINKAFRTQEAFAYAGASRDNSIHQG